MNDYVKYICVKKRQSKCVLWFIIDKDLGFELFVGAVYIPPQYSNYASDNPFELIESDFIQLNVNDSNMCLAGDFNGF